MRWTFRSARSLTSRRRKSTSTGPANDPVNSRNRSSPSPEIALSRFTPNRLPVRLMTGVWPTGAHERPAAASDRTPISSSYSTTPPSRRAWARMAGYCSSSQRRTATGFCSKARRCGSASQPPWRYCFIQRFTALGWTPNTRAASAWVIPSSTAWTARLRSAACAAPGRDRASSFDMPRAYDNPTLFACRSDMWGVRSCPVFANRRGRRTDRGRSSCTVVSSKALVIAVPRGSSGWFVVRLGRADDHWEQGHVDLPVGISGLVQDVVAAKLPVLGWRPGPLVVGVAPDRGPGLLDDGGRVALPNEQHESGLGVAPDEVAEQLVDGILEALLALPELALTDKHVAVRDAHQDVGLARAVEQLPAGLSLEGAVELYQEMVAQLRLG